MGMAPLLFIFATFSAYFAGMKTRRLCSGIFSCSAPPSMIRLSQYWGDGNVSVDDLPDRVRVEQSYFRKHVRHHMNRVSQIGHRETVVSIKFLLRQVCHISQERFMDAS
jgi:hypothetical protein